MCKCIICGKRPSQNGNGFCQQCQGKVDKERRNRQPAKPFRFVTYRGHVVGMFPNGKGTLTPRLLTISDKRLPKSNTINLNQFCEGFDKATIKALKAAVLKCANA